VRTTTRRTPLGAAGKALVELGLDEPGTTQVGMDELSSAQLVGTGEGHHDREPLMDRAAR
jgi:hypothetical protein